MSLIVSVISGCAAGDSASHHVDPQLSGYSFQSSGNAAPDAGAPAPASSVPNDVLTMIDELYAIYQPEAEALGKKLTITITESPTSTAMVVHDRWELRASRILLSEPISLDVIATILCHELGHLHGGYPFKPSSPIAGEPQADYFAGKECLPRLWQDEDAENAAHGSELDASVRAQCDAVWPAPGERAVCYRIAHAAEAFGAWEASRRSPPPAAPELTTPESNAVAETFTRYPSAQCRVDTIFQGGLCAIRNTPGIIPGYIDGELASDPATAALPYACQAGEPGARPSCWFAN